MEWEEINPGSETVGQILDMSQREDEQTRIDI